MRAAIHHGSPRASMTFSLLLCTSRLLLGQARWRRHGRPSPVAFRHTRLPVPARRARTGLSRTPIFPYTNIRTGSSRWGNSGARYGIHGSS